MLVSCLDRNCSFIQATFLNNELRVAAISADSAADAFVGVDEWGENRTHFVDYEFRKPLRFQFFTVDRKFYRSHFDRVVTCLLALDETQIAVLAVIVPERQTRLSVDDCQPHVRFAFNAEIKRLYRSRRANLRAEVALLVTTRVLGMGNRCPQRLQAELQPRRMQDGSGTDFEALSATDAQIEELRLRNAAWWSKRLRRYVRVLAGKTGCLSRFRHGCGRCPDQPGGHESSPGNGSGLIRRIIEDLQFDSIPAADELDGVRRADSTACLTVSAVIGSSREVFLNRIERAHFNALIAVDAGALDFTFADSEDVQDRQHRTARADITTPESSSLQAQ